MLIIGLWCIRITVIFAQATSLDALWSRIDAQVDQPGVDTTYQFILDDINSQCGGDANCLLSTYEAIRFKLERKFSLPATIKVTKELIRLAEQQGLLEKMAQGHFDLSRYYDALKEARSAGIHLDLAYKYFEQSGNKRKVIKCKFWKINLTSIGGNVDNTKKDLLASLVQEAMAEKDSALAGTILIHLLNVYMNTNTPQKCESNFALFEHIMNPDTKARLEKMNWGDFWNIKGDFERKYGSPKAAKIYYEKALAIIKEMEDPWRELNTTLHLVETDWALGNRQDAKNRLELALKMIEARNTDDLFVIASKIASKIAEEEGRHAEALQYLKKMIAAQKRIDQQGGEKIADNYFLEVENKNKALALKQSKDQLIYTIVIALLVLFLAAGLLIGFYKQRKSRRELAAQNVLIQAQTDQLKSLDLAKSRFFANVSHELRTPLTLLTSPIKTLLKENQLTQKQIQLLKMADRSGQQLGQLINEILNLRKLEMGNMTVSAEPTALRPWFQTYFAQFESLADQKQIEYIPIIPIPDQIIADLDREKCRQILFNLLSNAFKFTPAGGKIEAQVQVVEHELQISVKDSGPGIHPDDLPYVFERYFQTNRPDKPVEGGTGIGLALCREYAQLFGGTVSVESSPGQGAVFQVAFPIKMAEAKAADITLPINIAPAETQSAPMLNPAPDTDKPSILVVEDNTDLQAYIRFVLQDKYQVVTAENGQAAWTLLKENKTAAGFPDLILSDLMMPVMDGYQLLERLKSDEATRHLPVVMLTARAEAQDKLKALRIGVDDYLTKPFEEEELLVRIENLLKNQSARRAALAEDTTAPEVSTTPPLSQPDREWLETFEAYVQKHYSSDLLSVTSLAYEFAMSESTLLRQLKRLTGLSPLQYIQEVRLAEAHRLLENRVLNSIAQVASKVGYDDTRTFTRSFKQRFGKLPSEMM